MKHEIPSDTATVIDLSALLNGRGFRTITWENRGAYPLYVMPGIVPDEPLPDTSPPTQGYEGLGELAARKVTYVTLNGFTLPAGTPTNPQTLSRAASEEYPVTPVWTVVCQGAANNELYSITER